MCQSPAGFKKEDPMWALSAISLAARWKEGHYATVARVLVSSAFTSRCCCCCFSSRFSCLLCHTPRDSCKTFLCGSLDGYGLGKLSKGAHCTHYSSRKHHKSAGSSVLCKPSAMSFRNCSWASDPSHSGKPCAE